MQLTVNLVVYLNHWLKLFDYYSQMKQVDHFINLSTIFLKNLKF